MLALKTLTVTDSLGLTRKVVAGQTIPNELVAAYEAEAGEVVPKAQTAPHMHKALLEPEHNKAVKSPATAAPRTRKR